jgi:hypothetical protein
LAQIVARKGSVLRVIHWPLADVSANLQTAPGLSTCAADHFLDRPFARCLPALDPCMVIGHHPEAAVRMFSNTLAYMALAAVGHRLLKRLSQHFEMLCTIK